MIRFLGINYHLGERDLYVDLSWHIKPGERIGLVGDNGTGKTTLLRMITGELEPTTGQVVITRGVRVGFLKQEIHLAEDERRVLDEALLAFDAEREAQEELHACYDALATTPIEEQEELYDRIHWLEKRVRHHDMGAMESDARKVLIGLGFSLEDIERPLREFSGGWQMRAHLARLLLEEPDLLLLDEPTNHLDLESIKWLEEFLSNFPGSIVVVSHDRTFLDKMTNRTAWLSMKKVITFAKNYSGFLVERAEQEELLLRRYNNQQEELAHHKEFIDRFRAKASKATLVQSRIKMVEKIELIELPQSMKSVRLRIPDPAPCPRIPLELREAGMCYGTKRVLSNVNLSLREKDKVALIGPNGAGKTTLLRMLAGQLQLPEGERSVHTNSVIEYFGQHRVDDIDQNATLLDAVRIPGIPQTDEQLRTMLGCFLFSGDDVFKPVRVLSGGEKSRVALVRIMLRRGNVLLLDEPTNHLDITTRELLMKALQEFPGTVVVVSHDRWFIEGLATKLVEVGNGAAKFWDMGYKEWLTRQASGADAEAALRGRGVSKQVSAQAKKSDDSLAATLSAIQSASRDRDDKKKESADNKRERAEKRNALSTKIKTLEKQISVAEKRLAELHALMADPDAYTNGKVTPKITKECKDLEEQLPKLMAEWETASSEYEEVR